MAYRVVILCSGDHSRGMGHVYRMGILAEALSSLMECQVSFLVDPQTIIAPLSRGRLPEVHIISSDDLKSRRRVLFRLDPHLIIVDEYGVSEKDLAMYRVGNSRMIVLDSLTVSSDVADHVINAIVGGLVNREWSSGGRTRYYAGPKYMILHPDYRRLRPTRLPRASRRVTTVGVAMGGADALNLTGKIGGWLAGAGLCTQVLLVKGHGSQIHDLKVTHPERLVQIDRADSLAGFFIQCDLAVTGAGITLYEAACMGVPSIAVPQAPHEIETATRFERYGSAIMTSPDDKGDTILALVEALALDQDRRQAMAELGFALLDGCMEPSLSVIRRCFGDKGGC